MARYLDLSTPAGNAQIDDTYRNLVLVDKQTVTTYSSNPRQVTPTAHVSSSFVGQSVVALSGSGVAAWRASGDSSSFTLASASNNVTATVYFFALIEQQGRPNAGVLIKNAAGDVIFNTDYLPMRVSGIAKLPDLSMGEDPFSEVGASLSLNPSRTYAAMLSHQRFRFQRDLDAFTTYVFEDQLTAGSGGCSANLRPTRFLSYSTNPYPPAQPVGGLLLAIDVTNY